MKILYIHQYFKTPDDPGGTRSYWISRELISRGHKVTVLTSRAEQDRGVERTQIDGIDVIYIRNAYDNKFGIVRRLFSFLRFMILSYVIARKEREIDLVFATSTPLTVGVPALFLKWFKGIPFVFEVRDLWPEVPIQMKALGNPVVKALALKLEKRIYKSSSHIIALSPGMKDGVMKRGIKDEKVTMIPNMAKVDEFYLRPVNASLVKQLGLDEDQFHVLHFGAIGLANGVDYILQAAEILKDNKQIVFLFAGGGSQEENLKMESKRKKLENVRFLGSFNMAMISEIVNFSDCSLVSFANIPILRTNSPNKLFDSLSAQKPIIVNSSGWTKTMVEKHNCGVYVDPTNPNELATILKLWLNDRKNLKIMGENSRRLAETSYDKKILTAKVVNVLENCYNNV